MIFKIICLKILEEEINNRQELIEELQNMVKLNFLDKENLPPDPKTGKHNYDYIFYSRGI